MNVRFRITASLLAAIRADLGRPHEFAHERVGFILAALARSARSVLVVAHSYRPVSDEDYLRDTRFGAMIGAEAIRKAMEFGLVEGASIFHVHTHGGTGIPGFSFIDRQENAKFVPDFLKVAPQNIHGAVVLSGDAATGLYWATSNKNPEWISEFVEVGTSIRKWTI
jgi:hypothetical protein